MTINAERIAQIVFDEQPARAPGRLARLRARFSFRAHPAPKPVYNTLHQARMKMMAEGLDLATAHSVVGIIDKMSDDKIHDFIIRHSLKTGREVIINDVSWSDNAYLGVKIKSPAMDLQSNPEFIASFRKDFVARTQAMLDAGPQAPTLTRRA